jgi:NAD(P)-dependent dehydrogenase (short-subunit alcohol dehydrogenase family)
MARLVHLLRQGWAPPADPKVSFEGKNVIVTGANTGLGFEAAAKFVTLGASLVIIGVRDLAKGDGAKSAIEKRTGKQDRIEVWPLDMNSYDSIQEFAKRASSLDHLDVAVLNAGVFMVKYEESQYGWEETLQVNVLSTALLSLLLLPKLKASRTENSLPVLEIVSSGTHTRVSISEEHRRADNLLRSYNTANGYNAGQQYGTSKLFVMYVMQTLASFVTPSDAAPGKPDVVVTSVCPGACKSELSRGYNGFLINAAKAMVFAIFLRTTEQGSRSLVSGVTLGEEAHGRFWQHDQIKP